jgi:Cys-tRNA(Pro)/Cys-tRNA(Cys) deacylase
MVAPSKSTSVTLALDKLKVPYRFFRHSGKVRSLEQAAEERGQRPEQVVRSILFRLGQDDFVMVLVAGPQQVSWSALRAYLGQSRMTMASEEEVLKVTGYVLGSVSPFGLPGTLRILVDRRVMQQDEISIGSGERYAAVILKTRDMLQALGKYEAGEFSTNEA